MVLPTSMVRMGMPVQDEEAESAIEVLETAAAETESMVVLEEITTGSIEVPLSRTVSEHVALAPALEEIPASITSIVMEPDEVAAVPLAVEPIAAEKMSAPIVEPVKVQSDAKKIGTEVLTPQQRKLAEKAPASAASIATNTDPVATKKKWREQKKKESLGVLVKRFLNCEDPLPERRSIIRLLSQGLVAYTDDSDKTKPTEVRDVSPTGLYLRTEERWSAGDVVSLLLQRKGATEEDREKRVCVEARVVRCDEGGVGMSWLWSEGVEFEPWKRVHTKRSEETDADYFLRELRLARALGFLRQICPALLEELKLALHKRLSNKRIANAVEIAPKSLEMLGPGGRAVNQQVHPDMVRRIVESGSWTDDDWIRQWWAGLLVSSCSADAPDTSNSVFIDLLAKLMPAHLRVLAFACRKGTELIEAGASAATLEVYCTSEELIEAVASPSLSRIHQTMGQLSSLGLLAESNKPSYVAVTDKVKTRVTPTALGLKMYARCQGHP